MDVSQVKQQPVQPTQPPKRVEARQEPRADTKPKTAEAKPPEPPKPRPTTNAQGQQIGGRLSVTA